MTNTELILNMLAEASTKDISAAVEPKDFEESKELIEKGYKMLEDIIESTSNEGWSKIIETPFFGAVSKAKLFAHILYHNSYHSGQIGLAINKVLK